MLRAYPSQIKARLGDVQRDPAGQITQYLEILLGSLDNDKIDHSTIEEVTRLMQYKAIAVLEKAEFKKVTTRTREQLFSTALPDSASDEGPPDDGSLVRQSMTSEINMADVRRSEGQLRLFARQNHGYTRVLSKLSTEKKMNSISHAEKKARSLYEMKPKHQREMQDSMVHKSQPTFSEGRMELLSLSNGDETIQIREAQRQREYRQDRKRRLLTF